MADGSITKRCSCRKDGKRLGNQCPKLRRGNGWNPHHGVWRYQLELPLDDTNGRRQLRRSGFDTREEAAAERDHARALLDLAGRDEILRRHIADLLQACKPGQPLPDRDHVAHRIRRSDVPAGTRLTLGEYLAEWITNRTKLAPATRRSYQDHITKYWTPHLGQVPLQELTAAHIESVFTTIEAHNAEILAAKTSPVPKVRAAVKGIRTVGDASQQRILATLRKALNDARRLYHHRLVDHNPAESVELKSGKPPRPRLWTDAAVNRWRHTRQRPSPVMVWTPAQVGEFLDFAETEDPELYALFDLAIHRGPRRGELCGLHDYDVDLAAAAVTITSQRTSVGYQVIEKPVKSAAGDRVVDLSSETVTNLRRYLTRRAAWRIAAGDAWTDSDIFFVRRADGQPWHPETVAARFDRLVGRSGLPPIRFHDMRHVAATLMLAAGASIKEIQDTLGHSSYKMTADVYTSVLQDMKKTTAEATTKIIPRRNRPKAA
ncbi:tyrosine-type recombinase/integrase [Micromonospora sagamiensis]|uniref:Site-specific recombinase XerD n=1 Tax=Micromonospora sagamiensis TaxID=47875 RepID=A0A562WPY4_9ACTN|nr:tyrosine-type recombinase/integrase [Micromonospora sagamiensis]TWJ32285.1 site-specific recombinase XerD [Micromonospora sagamiensis]BCL14650.1 site-specific integrase [Micromonospora sagamiensis]